MIKKTIQKKIKPSFNDLINQRKNKIKKNSSKQQTITKPSHKFNLKSNVKKQKFNLDSDDENNQNIGLTHQGKSITEIDDFNENIDKDSNDSENEKIEPEIVNTYHFGGFDNENSQTVKKSKQDIYKEIIQKSKKMKYEKQKLKDENLEKIEEIDGNDNILMKILSLKKKEKKNKPEEDDYDKLAKEIVLETKAHAEDLIKDPKKISLKEKRKKTQQFDENEKIFSSDEDNHNEQINDDELEEKLNKEKRGINFDFNQQQKKQKKLNNFINEMKEIKQKKLQNQEISESSESYSDSEDEESDEEIDEYNEEIDSEDEEYENDS